LLLILNDLALYEKGTCVPGQNRSGTFNTERRKSLFTDVGNKENRKIVLFFLFGFVWFCLVLFCFLFVLRRTHSTRDAINTKDRT